MRFYDREQEIDFLRVTRETAKKAARFTVVTGRRRIGQGRHDTLYGQCQLDLPQRG